MKHFNQVQVFVAALVLVMVIALVSILAMGLGKYEYQKNEAEQDLLTQEGPVPTTPDAISDELQNLDDVSDAELDAELQAEEKALGTEDSYLQEVTQSYE